MRGGTSRPKDTAMTKFGVDGGYRELSEEEDRLYQNTLAVHPVKVSIL